MYKKTLSIIVGVLIIHILSLRFVFAEASHPNTGMYNAMMTYSERIVTRESLSAKEAAVEKYAQMDMDGFITTVEATLPETVSVRPDIEADICRMAQMYLKKDNGDYADKVYASLLLYAANYEQIKNTVASDAFSANSNYLPIYLAVAYDSVYSYYQDDEYIITSIINNKNVSNSLKQRISAVNDVKAYIEENFRTMAETVYIMIEGKYANNLSGYLVKKLAGIGLILDDPDIIRYAIAVIDLAFDESQWAADGMWFEGTTSYMSQLYGNILEAMQIINKYKDPTGYKEDKIKLGLKLNATDISDRWEIIGITAGVNNNIYYPNGEAVAIHDTHPSYRTYEQQKKTIDTKYLNNTELNHYGFMGMKSGDVYDAQETTLFFPPLASGLPFSAGHFHGNFLSMTLWAGGAELLPDAGYPVYYKGNHRYFHMNAVTHNNAWIWDKNINSYTDIAGEFARPNLLRYDKTDKLQIVEASELMPEVFQNKTNKRLLMQIQTSDNTSYTFDLQRLSGGTVHECFLRASEDENVVMSTDMSFDIEKDNLGRYLKENNMGGLMSDQTLFTGAKIYNGNKDFTFSWTGVDSGATLKAFIKGNEGMTSAFSKMPSLRRTENQVATKDDFPTYHLYRRVEAPNGVRTNYASVYEGVRAGDKGSVKGVIWQETDDKSVIAVVDLGEYEDIIVISDNFNDKYYDTITFACEVGYLRRRKEDKKAVTGYIHGGGRINANGELLVCEDTFKTKAVSANNNLIKVEANLPENAIGRWSNITFGDLSGISHRIDGVSGKEATLHNKAGFVLSDNVAKFTHFPKLYNKENKYPMNENERLDSRSVRTAEGEIGFSVPYSVLASFPEAILKIDGEWYLDTGNNTICNITEGTPLGSIVNSITAVPGYKITVAGISDDAEINNLYVTCKSCKNYLICISDGRNEESFTLSCKACIKNEDYKKADTSKKYMSNTYNTKNSRNVYGTFSTYWYFNDSINLTNEERCYGQIVEEDGNRLLKLDANGIDKSERVFAKLNYQYSGLSPDGVYSFSTKVKFKENAFLNFTAKIGNVNGGKFVNPTFLKVDAGKLYAGDVLLGSCRSDVWYEIENVIDYEKSRIAVFVNGIKYAEYPINANSGDRSVFSPIIEVGSSINQNCTEVIYFDDMAVKQIYGLNACTSFENKEYVLTLNKNEETGEYNASCNEQNILPEYTYAAVFCEHYSGDESSQAVLSELIGLYKVISGETFNVKIPDNVMKHYENTGLKGMINVRLIAWDSRMKPIKTSTEITE